MIGIALALMLQASQPPAAADGATQATSPSVADTQAEPPKEVCSWKPVTGTRAKRQYVCKTPAYLKNADKTQDKMRDMLQNSGNGALPKPPNG